jgi:hypothetical protein
MVIYKFAAPAYHVDFKYLCRGAGGFVSETASSGSRATLAVRFVQSVWYMIWQWRTNSLVCYDNLEILELLYLIPSHLCTCKHHDSLNDHVLWCRKFYMSLRWDIILVARQVYGMASPVLPPFVKWTFASGRQGSATGASFLGPIPGIHPSVITTSRQVVSFIEGLALGHFKVP